MSCPLAMRVCACHAKYLHVVNWSNDFKDVKSCAFVFVSYWTVLDSAGNCISHRSFYYDTTV